MFSGQVSIGKVAARCPAQTKPLVARLRIARLIESADIAPPGLPPQAILLIRRVAVPQELSLAAQRAGQPWEERARAAVAGLYRRAVRPARGQPVNGAEAVLFEDPGELLAWLGVEAQARVVERRWYWQEVLQGRAGSSPSLLAQAWVEAPRFVPAAVAYLIEWRHVTPVLRLFSHAQSDAVLSALVVEHGLPQPVWKAISGAAQPVAEEIEAETAVTRANMGTAEAGDEAAASPSPPSSSSSSPSWARWLGPAESEWMRLPPPTQRLLGLAITLFHAPARARSERFAVEMAAWLRRAVRRSVAEHGDEMRHQATSSRHASTRGAQSPDAPIPARRAPARFGDELSPLQSPPPAKKPDAIEPLTPPLASELREQAVEQPILWTPASIDPDQSVADASRVTTEEVEEMAAEPSPFWAGVESCQTEIGGALFLLNLFSHTGLPCCFDEDFELSRHLSGWGLTELFGRALLEPLGEAFVDDQLWAALALLEGREPGAPLAAQFQCGDEYRIPTAWLTNFVPASDAWQIRTTADRLTLWRDAGGFPVVDLPLHGEPPDGMAANEVKSYRRRGFDARLSGRPHRPDQYESPGGLPPLERWRLWVFPFLRWLLKRALGAAAETDEALARELLLKKGRLYCTRTHVDLVMSLEEVSLPVRRAGLDANPGWSPDLMRVVTFHFE